MKLRDVLQPVGSLRRGGWKVKECVVLRVAVWGEGVLGVPSPPGGL